MTTPTDQFKRPFQVGDTVIPTGLETGLRYSHLTAKAQVVKVNAKRVVLDFGRGDVITTYGHAVRITVRDGADIGRADLGGIDPMTNAPFAVSA